MSLVPTHPVTTPDPDVLRWIIPDGHFSFAGQVARAPRLLQALLDDGTLAGLVVEPGGVLTLLGEGHSWADAGARVRAALTDALGVPEHWVPCQGAQDMGPDEALEAAARQIARDVVGPFARSHGGSIEVARVQGGIVDLTMAGACSGCAAASVTVQARFEHLLRRRCPWLKQVRQLA